MITDLLKFTIKEEAMAEAIELMKKQMQDNLSDEGCQLAKTFRSKTNTNEIFMLLGWENQDAISRHLEAEHDQLFRENLDPLLAGAPEFFEWEPIE